MRYQIIIFNNMKLQLKFMVRDTQTPLLTIYNHIEAISCTVMPLNSIFVSLVLNPNLSCKCIKNDFPKN